MPPSKSHDDASLSVEKSFASYHIENAMRCSLACGGSGGELGDFHSNHVKWLAYFQVLETQDGWMQPGRLKSSQCALLPNVPCEVR